mgnify:CR=1 FL=1
MVIMLNFRIYFYVKFSSNMNSPFVRIGRYYHKFADFLPSLFRRDLLYALTRIRQRP